MLINDIKGPGKQENNCELFRNILIRLIDFIIIFLGEDAKRPLNRANNNAHVGSDEKPLKILIDEVFRINEDLIELEDIDYIDYTSIIVLLRYLTNDKLRFSDVFGAKYLPTRKKWWENIACNVKRNSLEVSQQIQEFQKKYELIDTIFAELLNEEMKSIQLNFKPLSHDKRANAESFYNKLKQKILDSREIAADDDAKAYVAVYIQKFVLRPEYVRKKDRKSVVNLILYLRLHNDRVTNVEKGQPFSEIERTLNPDENYWNLIEQYVICTDDIDYYKNIAQGLLDDGHVGFVKLIFDTATIDTVKAAEIRRLSFSGELLNKIKGTMTTLDAMHDYTSKSLWSNLLQLLKPPLGNEVKSDVNQTHLKMIMDKNCASIAELVNMNMGNFITEKKSKRDAIIVVLEMRANNALPFAFAESGNPLSNEKIKKYYELLIKSEQESFKDDLSQNANAYLLNILVGSPNDDSFVPFKLIDTFDGCTPTAKNNETTTHEFKSVYGIFNITIESTAKIPLCSNTVGHLVTTKLLNGDIICISGLVGPYTVNGSVVTLVDMGLIGKEVARECFRGSAKATSNAYRGTIEEFCTEYKIILPNTDGMLRDNDHFCIYHKRGITREIKILEAFAKKSAGDKLCEFHTDNFHSPITCLFTIDGCIKYMLLMSFFLGEIDVLPTVIETVGNYFSIMRGTSGENTMVKSIRMLQNVFNCVSILPPSDAIIQHMKDLLGGEVKFSKNEDVSFMYESLIKLSKLRETRCEGTTTYDIISKCIMDITIPILIEKLNATTYNCTQLLIDKSKTPLELLVELSKLPSIEVMLKESSIKDYSLNACSLSITKDLGRGRDHGSNITIQDVSLDDTTINFRLTRNGLDFLGLLRDEGHESIDSLYVVAIDAKRPAVGDGTSYKTWGISYEYNIGFLIELLEFHKKYKNIVKKSKQLII